NLLGSSFFIRNIRHDSGSDTLLLINQKNLYKIFYDQYLNRSKTVLPKKLPQVTCVSESNSDPVLLGTITGAFFYDITKNKIKQIIESKYKIDHLYFDSAKNEIWFSSNSNLYKYDIKKNEYTNLQKSINQQLNIKSIKLRSLTKDLKGSMWLGTYQGLIKIDDGNNCKQYIASYDSPNEPSSYIGKVIHDSYGRLWVGTNKGLYLYDSVNDRFIYYNKRINKREISVRDIKVVGEKKMLILSNMGLVEFDIEKKQFRQSLKLNDHVFETKPEMIINKNWLWLNTRENIWLLKNSSENSLKNNFPFAFTNVKINDGKVVSDVFTKKDLTLSFNQNNIKLFFSYPDYDNLDLINYAYKIKSSEKNWIDIGNQNYLQLNSLSPDNYQIEVKYRYSFGEWKPRTISLNLKIKPPFWKSNWAYLAYAISFIGLLLFFYFQIRKIDKLRFKKLVSDQELDNLKQLQKMRASFFTSLSHEIKTPLTLILSPLEKIIDGGSHQTIDESQVRMIQRNVKSLRNLISKLIDFRRVEEKAWEVNEVRMDLILFIEDIFNTFSAYAEECSIRYELNSRLKSYYTDFDPDILEKIITNLLSNAFKYTPNKGEVILQVSSSDKGLRIQVKDSGIGISKENQQHIFNRFFTVNEKDFQRSNSSGVGLSLVKDLVEILKGSITVESEEKKGSVFTLQLPYQEYQSEKKLPDEVINGEINEENNPTILIVDDNDDIRLYLKTELRKVSAYTILEATNGQEALLVVNKELPDLVISDIQMPKLTGVELCEKIKENVISSHIGVMLLTASSSGYNEITGLKAGADDYIKKPFNTNVLIQKVTNQLKRIENLKEKYKGLTNVKLEEIVVETIEDQLIKKVMKLIEENYENQSLDVQFFCDQVGLGRTQLSKKIKVITGNTLKDILSSYRIRKAKSLLLSKSYNINEVGYMVGFSSPSYFSVVFKKETGNSPKEFVENLS
ncbi:MAG: ATP-binding protein, partial [Cyclobacteriaceae bacterium]